MHWNVNNFFFQVKALQRQSSCNQVIASSENWPPTAWTVSAKRGLVMGGRGDFRHFKMADIGGVDLVKLKV